MDEQTNAYVRCAHVGQRTRVPRDVSTRSNPSRFVQPSAPHTAASGANDALLAERRADVRLIVILVVSEQPVEEQ